MGILKAPANDCTELLASIFETPVVTSITPAHRDAAPRVIGAASASLRNTNVPGSRPPLNPTATTGKEVPHKTAARAVCASATSASLPKVCFTLVLTQIRLGMRMRNLITTKLAGKAVA